MAKIADLKTHKFIVALSFPGERYRKDVRKFYELLRARLPKPQHAIFFDEAYEGELTQKNLDHLLRDLYKNALLFVPFFSEEYQRSKWCMNVEWSTIKDNINQRTDEAVFYIRCDDTAIEGITWKDGYQDLRKHSLDEIAGHVAKRARKLKRQEKEKKKGASAITSQSPTETTDRPAPSASSASPTVFAPPPKQTKVLFLSALGQWTEGLQMLLPKGKVSKNLRCEVVDWQASMKELKEVEGTYGQATLKTQSFNGKEYPIDEWLYVFVSPFSLAAKWTEYKNLRVLGPAFGSSEDISIHMRRNGSFTKGQPIRVGMIDDDITSSILFQILVSFMNDWFSPAKCPADQPCKIPIKELYQLESFGGWDDRLSLLNPQDTRAFDACVFTAKELISIKGSKKYHEIKPREILKIDPPIAHILQIDGYVPRAVYFIQTLQYYRQKEINDLLNWLNIIVPRQQERSLVGGIRPLLPGDDAARLAQKIMIERAQELGINIHSVNFERLKDGVLSP